jgi:hypothetical protein
MKKWAVWMFGCLIASLAALSAFYALDFKTEKGFSLPSFSAAGPEKADALLDTKSKMQTQPTDPKKLPTAETSLSDSSTFALEALKFKKSGDEFESISFVQQWQKKQDTRALPVLVEQGARGGDYLRGAVLQALGSLGRSAEDEKDRASAFALLAERVKEAAQKPAAMALGDGLIACDALTELGWKRDTSLLASIVTTESKTIAWTLAERIVLTLEALGAPETKVAALALEQDLASAPNAMFAALEKEDRMRIAALVQRLRAAP